MGFPLGRSKLFCCQTHLPFQSSLVTCYVTICNLDGRLLLLLCAYECVYQVQLQWAAMQVTGHLPFTLMLSAGHLHGCLFICLMFWYLKSGVPGKVTPGRVKELLVINQTSDWSLAIHFVLGKVGHLFN